MKRTETMNEAWRASVLALPRRKAQIRKVLDDYGPMTTSEVEEALGGIHQSVSATIYHLMKDGRARWMRDEAGVVVLKVNSRGFNEQMVEACDIPPPPDVNVLLRGWVRVGVDGRVELVAGTFAEVFASRPQTGDDYVEVDLRPVRTRDGRCRRRPKGKPDEPPAAPSALTAGPSEPPSAPGASDAPDPVPDLPAWWGKE